MKKKIKKAFTLVELLVVIAILAILATVSIVGYNSFTKKAKVSNDTALVSQLNTLLKADSMVNGDAKTPTDALKITSEAGYDVEKLTPTTNNYEIIWNQAINQFALLDEKENVVYGEKSTEEYKNWKFVSEYNSATDYSVYLKGTEITSIPNAIHAGIDVGNNTAITTVNYTNGDSKDDVRIRTNGGTLSVDASNDAVWHYGDVQNVSIKAIDNESYHEAGTVSGNLEIESGHLAIENAANVSTIIVKPTNIVKVTVAKEENVGTIVTKDLTKTTLNVPESLKPSENITDAKLNEMKNFAGGIGTKESPYLIETEEQFLRINDLYASAKDDSSFQNLTKYTGELYCFKQVADFDVSSVASENYVIRAFTGNYDGNGYTLTLNEHENSLTRYSLFRTIFGKVSLKNMNVHLKNGAAYTLIAINDFTSNNPILEAELNNITVTSDKVVELNTGIYGIFWSNYAKNFKSIRFINCINRADISNGGTTTGVFTGSGWDLGEHAYNYTFNDVSVVFENCKNYGSIVGNNQVGVIYGHRQYVSYPINNFYSFVKVNGVENYGKIKATERSGCARFAPIDDDKIANDRFANYTSLYQSLYSVGDNVFDASGVTVSVNYENNEISTNAEGVTFKLSYVITSMYYDGVPSNTTEFIYDLEKKENVNGSNLKVTARNSKENETLVFDSYGISISKKSVDELELIFNKVEGRTFGINDTYSNVSVFVKAYDVTGMLIGSIKIK